MTGRGLVRLALPSKGRLAEQRGAAAARRRHRLHAERPHAARALPRSRPRAPVRARRRHPPLDGRRRGRARHHRTQPDRRDGRGARRAARPRLRRLPARGRGARGLRDPRRLGPRGPARRDVLPAHGHDCCARRARHRGRARRAHGLGRARASSRRRGRGRRSRLERRDAAPERAARDREPARVGGRAGGAARDSQATRPRWSRRSASCSSRCSPPGRSAT